ncbi:hypothetical protein D3C72_2277350 [compost metagenome]
METARGRDGLDAGGPGKEALGEASERRASEAGWLVTMRVPKSNGMASITPSRPPMRGTRVGDRGRMTYRLLQRRPPGKAGAGVRACDHGLRSVV